MKKVIFLLAVAALLSASCTSETIDEIINYGNLNYRIESNFVSTSTSRVVEDTNDCFYSELLAGQTIDAGSVTANFDALSDEVVITYKTDNNWTINEVHLSISDYDNPTFPSTGSGNPKIGQFEYTANFDEATNTVSFIFDAGEIGTEFSMAAHAVVENNGNQETAWANGIDFGGKSWATYGLVDFTICFEYEELE